VVFSIRVFEAMKKTGLLKLCQADKEELSEETLGKIEKSKNNPNRRLSNFQG